LLRETQTIDERKDKEMRIYWLLFCLMSNIAFGQMIYDGEKAKFSASSSWDQNGSKLSQMTISAYSKPKHLRAVLKNKDYWGAAAYVPANWKPYDFSKAESFSFYAKSDKPVSFIVQLFDETKAVSSAIVQAIDKRYKQVSIPVSAFDKIDKTKVTAIVFAVSQKLPATYTIDIDNIELSGTAEPTPEPTPTPEPPQPPPDGTTMKTGGKYVYDACGQKMILRGVNQMTCWTDWIGTPRDGMPMFSEIAKTGANAVRIVWIYTENTTVDELDRAITNAANYGMIPMIEIHNQTCNWSTDAMTEVLNWWTKPEVVALIKKHQKYLMVNFANEMGTGGTTAESFKAEYSRVISAMRVSGIHTPIVIDSSSCGQDESMIMQTAQSLVASDPDHNLVFSLHIYWTDQNIFRIVKAMTDANSLNIPMIIGEFANKSVDCSTPILYKDIIKQSEILQIGYFPWSWDHQNACVDHSMTKDANQSFDTLWGWALEVSVTDPYSIKNTSIKSNCFGSTPTPQPTPLPGTLAPMPVISRGIPAYASSGSALESNDSSYDTQWRSSGNPPVWIAYDLSKLPATINGSAMLGWYADNANHGLEWLSGDCYNCPGNYRIDGYPKIAGSSILPSANDTKWVSLVDVQNNYISRAHVLALKDYAWIRMYITSFHSALYNKDAAFNLDIHDASLGTNDSWIFLGDSITAMGLTHEQIGTKNLSQMINAALPNYFPLIIDGGTGGMSSDYGAKNIARWLKDFPGKYVALAYGTNDAGWGVSPDVFYSQYESMVKEVLAANKIPIIPTIPWLRTSAAERAQTLNLKLTILKSAYPQIIEGPDLWEYFKNNQSLISADNIHPTEAGYIALREQWAKAMLANVYRK
jgi:lysophospholipase L1-like esterase/thiol-disulfide isomerase/thioredoxin